MIPTMVSGLNFAEFLKATGEKPAAVAKATGLHAATIIRIRDQEQTPDYATVQKLNEWAKKARRKARLTSDKRLCWDYLLDGSGDGAAA